jgi:hypothetical protein
MKIGKMLWAMFSKVEKRDWNIEGGEGAIETTKDIRQQKYEISVLKLLTPCILIKFISLSKPNNCTYKIENSTAFIAPTSSTLFCHHQGVLTTNLTLLNFVA